MRGKLSISIALFQAALIILAVERTTAASPPVFTEANWVSMGGIPGASGPVYTLLANTNSGLMYAGGTFTNIGNAVAANVAVWNGSKWSALGSGLGGQVNALALDGAGNLYAGGLFTNSGNVSLTNVAKWTGTNWVALGSGLNGTVYSLAADYFGNVFVGGQFTTAGGIAATNLAQWNGSAWSGLGSPQGPVYALNVDYTGNLYAGGAFTAIGGISANHIAKWNGGTWMTLSSGLTSSTNQAVVYALLSDAAGNVYAGGTFANAGLVAAQNIARWNGATWLSTGATFTNSGVIQALTFDNLGNLYIGGIFSMLNTATNAAANVAEFNGTNWITLGLSLRASVNALGCDTAGSLFAGGNFATYNVFTVANYISKWDGTSWHDPLSIPNSATMLAAASSTGRLFIAGALMLEQWDGTNWLSFSGDFHSTNAGGPLFRAITADANGNFYIGGLFSSIGTNNVNNIARWNGTAWQSLGPGVSGANAVAADAAGNVFVPDTGFSGYVNKWNGTNWINIGPNAAGDIEVLVVDGKGNLYAAGDFFGKSTKITKWNGQSWNFLGPDNYPFVRAMTVDKSGTLYAAKTYGLQNGLTGYVVAKWAGTSWVNLSSNATSSLYSPLTSLGCDRYGALYVAGSFTNIGNINATNIARWDGRQWWALGSGVNNFASSLAVDNGGHLYVGGIFTKAGTNLSYYVAQANLAERLGIISVSTNSNATVTINFQAITGNNYILQASPDLVHWTNAASIVCGTNGICSFTNAIASSPNFYRAASQ